MCGFFIIIISFKGNSKGKRQKKIVNRTQNYLNLYAADGLRTLCIAKKVTRIYEPPKMKKIFLYLSVFRTLNHFLVVIRLGGFVAGCLQPGTDDHMNVASLK